METHPRSIFYPPGGLMIWLFILIELCTFGGALVVFAFEMRADRALFLSSQERLNLGIAVVNTITLLTSGFLVARGVAEYGLGRMQVAAKWTFGGACAGTFFLILKSVEYYAKYSAGLTPGTNTFFSFYWAITGFHFMHVLLGVFILCATAVKLHRGTPFPDPDVTPATGAAYWHMCDLIWVLVFPILYLFH